MNPTRTRRLILDNVTSESSPPVATTCDQASQQIAQARRSGQVIGLVPTMGALHEGHLSLVREASRQCEFVIVSIFVNPTQFDDGSDLARYPRKLSQDLQALSKLPVDLVFAPQDREIYPQGFSTTVRAPRIAAGLEGACRSGHFDGVATVVLKLFQLIPAHVAYFGEKDFQQMLVVRDMVRDLNVPIRLQACPIVRESDGLAMSSRNRNLSPAERKRARALSRALDQAEDLYTAGQRDASTLESRVRQVLRGNGVDRIDYVAVRCAQTLDRVKRIDIPAVLLIAAHVGSTRLIDNRRLG